MRCLLLSQNASDHSITSDFVAWVEYIQPPFSVLQRWFPNYVNPAFKGCELSVNEPYWNVNHEPREILFEYVPVDERLSIKEARTSIIRTGVRLATFEELLGFSRKYSREPRTHRIVAAGSEALIEGDRRVPYLWHGFRGRLRLDLCSLESNWENPDEDLDHLSAPLAVRYLGVREAA